MQFYIWRTHRKYARYWSSDYLSSRSNNSYEVADEFFSQRQNPTELNHWNPPHIREHMEKGRSLKIGDNHSSWGTGQTYFISQNMIEKMGDILEDYGVCFPIDVDDRNDCLYRYWVTKELDCLDREKSELMITNNPVLGERISIHKLTVIENSYDGSMIFRVKDDNSNVHFVTSEFIDIVKKHNLKGFEFRRDFWDNKPILVG